MHTLTGVLKQLCLNHGIHLAVKNSIAVANSQTDFDDFEDDVTELLDSIVEARYSEALKKMRKVIGIFSHSALLKEKLDGV